MAIICCVCHERKPRRYSQTLGTVKLCDDCYDEGYRIRYDSLLLTKRKVRIDKNGKFFRVVI